MVDFVTDTAEAVSILEDLLDDDGLLEEDAPSFEKEEIDEDGDDIEDEDAPDEEDEDSEEDEEDLDEDSDEEGSDEDEDSEAETEEGLFEVEIDGEVYEVNKEELVSGYLRNEEFTKRQTELEEKAQAKEAELDVERQRVADYLDGLILEGNVTLQKYRNFNWERLRADDPVAYRDARLEYIEAQEAQEARQGRRNQIAAMHQRAQEIKHESYLKSQKALAQKLIPEVADDSFVQSLVDYGKSVGLSEEDVRGISDAKSLFILNQARLFAESQVKKKEALQKKVSKDLPPVIKPGAPKTKAQADSQRSKVGMAKLRSTGNVRDAASILIDFV